MKITILISTYCASKEDLRLTLDSAMCQEFDSWQIVVCDDGSPENHEAFLREYFNERGFSNFRLVMNSENHGTVKNLLSGLAVTEGKYVKPIGAGDFLADAHVLEKAYAIMEGNQAICMFSDLKCFRKQNGRLEPQNHISIPRMKRQYASGDYTERMKRNILVLNDHISGASMFYRTEALRTVLEQMKGKVKYMEDLCQYLFLLQGEKIVYVPEPLVWYEVAEGISNVHSADSNSRMKRDKEGFLNDLFETYCEDPYICRRRRIEEVERKYHNKIIKGILKTAAEPQWLLFRIHRR